MRPRRSGKRSVVFVFPALDDHPSFRGADELDDGADIGVLVRRRELGDGLRYVHRGMHQNPVSGTNGVDAIARETTPLESNSVDPVELRAIADGLGERQHILGSHRITADEGVGAHPAELMNAAVGADGRVVEDGDVPRERRGVREDDGISHDAIVGDVGIGHEQVAVADDRPSSPEGGPAVNGDELAEGVVVADLERRDLPLELEVLGLEPYRGEREDPVALADGGIAGDDGMGLDHGVAADGNVLPHDAVRTDANSLGEPRAFVDHRGRVAVDGDRLHVGSTPVRVSSASAASWPSTSALPASLRKLALAFSSVTVTRSWSPGTTGRRNLA